MELEQELDIIRLVADDDWMMDVLQTAGALQMPDWWVCAGFVRSKIWDVLHGYTERTPLADVDVIYFDPGRLEESVEKQLEKKLRSMMPRVPWSVKNEARMHIVNGIPPYTSSVDAISKFPETATALGLTLDEKKRVILAAPHGIEDAVRMRLRPTPHFMENKELSYIYEERIMKKNWKSIWPRLQVYHIDSNDEGSEEGICRHDGT